MSKPYGTLLTHPMNLGMLERYSNFPKKYGIILRHDTQS